MPGRRGKDRKRETSCAHGAAGTELKSPDLEPRRENSHLWVSDSHGMCSKLRFRIAYNSIIKSCPSKN